MPNKMEDRAWRCENWVIWIMADWTDSGWINLCMTQARSTMGVRRTAFNLGWNGERFAVSHDLKKMRKIDPDAEAVLASFLARELQAPEMADA